MAKNRKHPSGHQLSVGATDPATPVSGDPVLFGQRPGVALTDERTDGTTTVQFDGVFDLSVKGTKWDSTLNAGAGAFTNVAIAAGDIVYYTPGRTPVLDAGGDEGTEVRYGYAGEAVASGATTTIEVIVGQ